MSCMKPRVNATTSDMVGDSRGRDRRSPAEIGRPQSNYIITKFSQEQKEYFAFPLAACSSAAACRHKSSESRHRCEVVGGLRTVCLVGCGVSTGLTLIADQS